MHVFFPGREWTRRTWLIGLLCVVASGCGGDAKKVIGRIQDDAGKAVEQAVATTTQVLNLAGNIELATNPPVSIKAGYAALVPPGENRSAVLQITSYQPASRERGKPLEAPAVMLRAEVPSANPADLAGKTFKAQLFVQLSEGVVLFTKPEQSVELAVKTAENKQLTIEIASGALTNSSNMQTVNITGAVVGILP